ncbi:DNA polymerase beta domain protein region [Candidatus Sulfopaludibacter sp. SbA4]|nr:DNA polymerase beta domain protein region [Candidatus Sulfopaludibacter sp. SbA4]
MTLDELRSRYRDRIIGLAEKRGAHNVRVFGSVARGDQRSDSDIDFLVDFEPGRSLLDLTGFWLDLEGTLGCKVDVVSSRGLRPRVAPEVMRDAIAL